MDRTADSGKSRGGGVCVMVNNSWCNNANVVTLACSCSPNLELLALKLRPFYLPREFTSVIINTVYIPPQANMDTALWELHEALTQFQAQHRDTALIVVGDFNSANLKRAVPNLYQHVTVPTRGNRTLDHNESCLERHYQPVRISGTTVERVDSFRYLGVHISQDLSWSRHTNSLAKKAHQHLYHLRRLRDFRLPSKVLRNFYTYTIESILTGNITVWFGNSTMQDRQALQRVVHSAECITHLELPDLQTIYYKRCQTKARRIVKDPTDPNNKLFSLMRSGKRFRSLKTKTQRLKRSFFPQAIQALNQGN
ncbi:hypothetical protein P4O66_019072 [Electrophorus voltai]|uniref:Alkylated DNA repair protein AlkB homologue 8 N-terminal domain-containing protein n=1 Tax=Electrophorus voltai TaxID=2609070 RepID=A0AAD8YTJ1_9TELE|nr:hypothetical protein P4O66_019072 [Electrophorus voltai]